MLLKYFQTETSQHQTQIIEKSLQISIEKKGMVRLKLSFCKKDVHKTLKLERSREDAGVQSVTTSSLKWSYRTFHFDEPFEDLQSSVHVKSIVRTKWKVLWSFKIQDIVLQKSERNGFLHFDGLSGSNPNDFMSVSKTTSEN